MLSFGKKVNYRPLLVSLSLAFIIGLLFKINLSLRSGIEIGTIVFLLVFLGHYLLILPIIFNYWDSQKENIRYSDNKTIRTRLAVMFYPRHLRLKEIAKNDIVAITLLGLPQKSSNPRNDPTVSEETGLLYNLTLLINQPIKIRLTLRNKTVVALDLSNDYVNRPEKTLGKLNIFLNSFNPQLIHLTTETREFLHSK